MKINQYINEYTSGEKILFKHILAEVRELFDEVIKLNGVGIKEEFEDVLHFLQLWLFWKFEMDGEVWRCTKNSVGKFKSRVAVWRDIYEAAGLKRDISNFCGNYKKEEKVILQLGKFGISREVACAVFQKVVVKKENKSKEVCESGI